MLYSDILEVSPMLSGQHSVFTLNLQGVPNKLGEKILKSLSVYLL